MAKNYDKEQIIADWETGGYTVRELADKHSVGRTTIGNLVKGVDKILMDKVSAKLKADKDIRRLPDKKGQAVQEILSREEKKRFMAEQLDDYLDKAMAIAAKVGVKILNSGDASMMDVSQFAKAQNDMRVGLKTQDKFSSSGININNTNAQQNTGVIRVPIMSDEEWQIKAAASQEKLVHDSAS